MTKRTKIIFSSLVSLLVIAVIIIVVANAMVASKIENILQTSLPSNIALTYDELDVSILSGYVKLSNPNVTIIETSTNDKTIQIVQSAFIVDGLNIWRFLLKDEINIDAILIQEPKVEYHLKKHIPSEKSNTSKPKGVQKDIKVEKVTLTNGTIFINDAINDSLIMTMKNVDFKMSNISIDSQTILQKIPFKFGTYELSFDDFYYQLNDFDGLKLEHATVSNNEVTLQMVNLNTKYSRKELSERLNVERDHMDLKIDELTIEDQEFGYKSDSLFFFTSPKVKLKNPNLNVFRDKLINDDTVVKSLYSRMLRDLNFDLTLSELVIDNGVINYTEKVKSDNDGGTILFTNIDATIKNVSNTYSAPEKTSIDLTAIFMKNTPMDVKWEFDVNNMNDHFVFKGDMGKLSAIDMNPFSVPNLGVKLEGELSKTYFTIDGNVNTSGINLKMNYDSFKVMILDKEGKEKNKFLSVVANLFISKNSDKSDDEFREGFKTGVERDKTKSVFNFVWLNIRAGLVNAMVGNGKK